MFGLAIMLKKGLHLHVIHNLNRPFDELMLGLENWIPLYMTGQISPYYFKHDPDPVFGQLLNVSGHAALSGECICGHHAEGRYYLTRTRQECHYYKKKASYMLDKASPLMKIYRAEDQQSLYAFLHKDVSTPGARLGILSALPLYTYPSHYFNRYSNVIMYPQKSAHKFYLSPKKDENICYLF